MEQDAVETTRKSRRQRKTLISQDVLKKIKHSRETGERIEVAIPSETKIFDLVDEKEYARIVRKRQAESWIMGDEGNEYMDDGREVFDEDYDSGGEGVVENGKMKKNTTEPEKKKRKNNVDKNSIKAMLLRNKPKDAKSVTLEGDEALDDCLAQLEKTYSSKQNASDIKFRSINPPCTQRPKVAMGTNGSLSPVKSNNNNAMVGKTKMSTSSHSIQPNISMATVTKVHIKKELEDEIQTIENVDLLEGLTEEDFGLDLCLDEGEAMEQDLDVKREVDIKEEMIEDSNTAPEVKLKPKIKHIEDDREDRSSIWDVGWETTKGKEPEEVTQCVDMDTSQLPVLEDEDGQFLPFFWLDAYEDAHNQPGTVFLFGKVPQKGSQQCVSGCVIVKNIERCLYFLPREYLLDKTGHPTDQEVQIKDIYQEFNEKYAEKFQIMKFSSKRVEKKYAFEKSDVPSESEYLEVRYLAKYPAPPMDSSGRSYSHIFGTNTSYTERLVVTQQIKGPCWLKIRLPNVGSSVSWCKVECSVESPDQVVVAKEQAPPPPLTVMGISTKTCINPKSNSSEILTVGVVVNNAISLDKSKPQNEHWSSSFNTSFCGIRKMANQAFPYDFSRYTKTEGKFIEVHPTERALLGFLLAKVHKLDPDVIVGHGVSDFELDVLIHRVQANKVPHWSKISRLKRNNIFKGHMQCHNIACGRLVCDVKISSKELIRARSYDLTELANHVLKFKHPTLSNEEVKHSFSSTKTLRAFIAHTMNDALVSLGIMFELNTLPLAYQITRIAGNVLSGTLLGGRAERNEFLLLHAFTTRGYIPPDKASRGGRKGGAPRQVGDNEDPVPQTTSGRRKPAYSGGLVLEPKKGFYDKFILLLDFNSLYPSIIQEYNIDFTTVQNWQSAVAEEEVILELPSEGVAAGVLPTEIRTLVTRRREVKKLMKQHPVGSDLYQQYDIRQKALKLTANSMYGCLGFSNSRFFAQPLAALITSKGREILSRTKDLVEQMNLEVIYGDTDSIMINSNLQNYPEVMELGQKIKQEVNKLYRLLEIDIDGVFKTMLLLKKKKYAAITIEPNMQGDLVESLEMKGLDIVRRDWCVLAKEVGEWVLKQILSGCEHDKLLQDIQGHLEQVGENVRNGQFPQAKFIITKSLSRSPENYSDSKSLPHVSVALRMNAKGTRIQSGDVVPYIICNTGSESGQLPATQRAFHPRELDSDDSLTIDTDYYLQQQVHAVVTRLCEPISGMDSAFIAQSLGLDPSHFRGGTHNEEDDTMEMQTAQDDNEKYKHCDPLDIRCPNCSQRSSFKEEFNKKCGHCQNELSDLHVKIQVNLLCRKHIQKYYQGWMVCEDVSCMYRTRQNRVQTRMNCPKCQRSQLKFEYSAVQLHNQLCFFDKLTNGMKILDRCLSVSAYNHVQLGQLFEGLYLNC